MRLENGYETCTTFWEDFTIADAFGDKAIEDTFKRSFKGWKYNVKYMTELAMVMSWKSCAWYEKNQERSALYSRLYHQADEYCLDNFKGEDLRYYIQTTD